MPGRLCLAAYRAAAALTARLCHMVERRDDAATIAVFIASPEVQSTRPGHVDDTTKNRALTYSYSIQFIP